MDYVDMYLIHSPVSVNREHLKAIGNEIPSLFKAFWENWTAVALLFRFCLFEYWFHLLQYTGFT